MKKVFALCAFFLCGLAILSAQTATDTKADQSATPAVKASDMCKPEMKCEGTGSMSCCHASTSRTAAVTGATATEASTEATSAEESESQDADAAKDESEATEKKCQTVGFGMSAEKPR